MRIARLIETAVGALMLLLLMAASSYDGGGRGPVQTASCQEKSAAFARSSCGSLSHHPF